MSKAYGISQVMMPGITAAHYQTVPAAYCTLKLKFAVLNTVLPELLHTSFLSLLLTDVSIARQSFPADKGRLLPFKLPAWVIQLVPKSRQGNMPRRPVVLHLEMKSGRNQNWKCLDQTPGSPERGNQDWDLESQHLWENLPLCTSK